MKWILFILLAIIHTTTANVTLTIQAPESAIVDTPFNVSWTWVGEDPGGWRLIFVDAGVDGADAGFAGKVQTNGLASGDLFVKSKKPGKFQLRAVQGRADGFRPLAYSKNITISSQNMTSPSSTTPSNTPTSTTRVATPDPNPLSFTSTTASPTNLNDTHITTTPTATSDPNSISSSSSTAPPTLSNNSPKRSSMIPAIVGGVIGGVALLSIVAVLLIILRRRRRNVAHRLTFHRDLMVQRRDPPRLLESPDLDLEAAAAIATPRNIYQPTVVSNNTAHTRTGSGQTTRQLEINTRIMQLQEKILEIQSQIDMVRVLEQMRLQVEWLRDQQYSHWALGLTDVPPPGYDLYMKP